MLGRSLLVIPNHCMFVLLQIYRVYRVKLMFHQCPLESVVLTQFPVTISSVDTRDMEHVGSATVNSGTPCGKTQKTCSMFKPASTASTVFRNQNA